MDPCKEIGDRIRKYEEDRKRRNAELLASKIGSKSSKAQDVKDEAINKYGLDKEAVEEGLNNVPGDAESEAVSRKVNEEIANEALAESKQAENPDGTLVKGWLQGKAEALRKFVSDAFGRASSVFPKDANEDLKKIGQEFGAQKGALTVMFGDKIAIVGDAAAVTLKRRFEETFESIKDRVSLGKQQIDEGMWALAHTRDEAHPTLTKEGYKQVRDELQKVINANIGNEGMKVPLTQLDLKLKMADAAIEHPELINLINDHFESLTTIGEAAHAKGLMASTRAKSYIHNTVDIILKYRDPADWLEGPKSNRTNMNKAKKYDNGLKAMSEGGVMPTFNSFTDEAATYLKSAANGFRRANFLEKAKDPYSNMMVETAADAADRAFITRDRKSDEKWETPKDSNGIDYRDLGGIMGDKWDGVYAHPQVERWLSLATKVPEPPGGIVKFALRANGLLNKTVLLGFPFMHGGAFTLKGTLLGATSKVEGWANPYSVYSEGLAAASGKNLDNHVLYLELVQNGMGLKTHDLIRNPLMTRKFDEGTGLQTQASSIAEKVDHFTNFEGSFLFGKWHLGQKTGMGIRLMKSDWFTNLVKQKGGDRDAAVKVVAEILNDTFGGRNMEMIGRHPTVQLFMQASLLAPDWQESKMRRLFGTTFNDDPAIRKSYQAALTAEMAVGAIATVAAQQIVAATLGHQRSLEEMWGDWKHGRFGAVYIGKNATGKEEFVMLNPAMNQDARIFSMLLKGLEGTLKGNLEAGPRELALEASKKLGVGPRVFSDLAFRKQKSAGAGPSEFDRPFSFLPADIQEPISAARGVFGDKGAEAKAVSGLKRFGAQAVGLPIQTATPLKKTQADEAKEDKKRQKAGWLGMSK